MEYDEDRELTRYVWEYCGEFFTEFEWEVSRVIFWSIKLPPAKSADEYLKTLRKHGFASDAAVRAALANGPELFRRRLRERVLAEYGADVFVNRCPSCNRVARTPQARQCFWCGFDWHA